MSGAPQEMLEDGPASLGALVGLRALVELDAGGGTRTHGLRIMTLYRRLRASAGSNTFAQSLSELLAPVVQRGGFGR
jgi:hypothetical protein